MSTPSVSRLLWKVNSCEEAIERWQAKALLWPSNAARYHQLIEKARTDITKHKAALAEAGYSQTQ